MNGALGHTGVLLGFAAAVIGVVVLAVGLARGRIPTMRSGQLYAPVVFVGGLLALAAMEHALLTHDFSLSYVAANNSRSTPWLYSITGLWSALAGSILLWGVVLGGYATAMVWRFRKRSGDQLVAWATLVVYVVAAFFFGLMLGPADPFKHVAGAVPTNGPGPNSLLQNNPLVLIHPPMLYLGLVGFTLPFAFAIASLITGRLDEDWQGETRRWTLFAWAFLSMGILLGAWWSYQVLGWGGFWGWDPVENAALLPWLVGTAYLHSVMVQQRRGLLRIWNLSLVVAAFSLTILGTFLTRSGVIQSVHSFSQSTIGPLLLGFFGVVLFTGVGLIAWRGDRLHSVGGIDSPISREGAFLANNLLFVGFAFVVLLGTVFPLLYEALHNGSTVGVGAPYFNRFFVPVGLALLFLMAVAPALPWRKTTLEVMRGRLAVPAAVGVITLVVCVLAGVRGIEPLLAFGLGAFAAASAGRSLVALGAGCLPRVAVGRGPALPGGPGRMARVRGPGQWGHGGAHRCGGGRHWTRRRHVLPPPQPGPPVGGQERHIRRPHRRVRGNPGGDHPVALLVRGDSPGRRRRTVLPGAQPVRHRQCHRRDAGHRLELEGRPLSDHRRHTQQRRHLGAGHGLGLRCGRAAPGDVAVGRGRPHRCGLGPVGHPREAPATDGPGVGSGRCGIRPGGIE